MWHVLFVVECRHCTNCYTLQAYEADQDETVTSLQEKINNLEENARNLRDIIVNISGDVFEEEDEGTRFRVKNMPEIREDSRLIGEFE